MADAILPTSKICKKCGSSFSGKECLACARLRARLWRLNNLEKSAAYSAAYKKANRKKKNAQNLAWLKAHPEKVVAYRIKHKDKAAANTAAWQAKNHDRFVAGCAAYREANREKCKAACRASYQKNPDGKRVHVINRRAKIREDGGRLSKGLAEKLFKLQKGKCPCCGLPLGENYHLDHIMPIDLGGQNIDGNIQLLRQQCNNQKYVKHPVDFMQSRGFLL